MMLGSVVSYSGFSGVKLNGRAAAFTAFQFTQCFTGAARPCYGTQMQPVSACLQLGSMAF